VTRLPPANTLPCVMCGQRGSNRHERVPRSQGGPRDAFNTVILCGSGTTGCHGWVTEHPKEAKAMFLDIPGQFVRGFYVGPDPEFRRHYNGEVWTDQEGWVTV
jgi:hypothetical protein